MLGIILAAALSAFTMLHLDPLAQLLSGFIVVCRADHRRLDDLRRGLWLATWASNFVIESGWPHKYLLALVARIGIIVLSLAMALTRWASPTRSSRWRLACR